MSSTDHRISVIIPAFNEENSVGKVIRDLPKSILEEIIDIPPGFKKTDSRDCEQTAGPNSIILVSLETYIINR